MTDVVHWPTYYMNDVLRRYDVDCVICAYDISVSQFECLLQRVIKEHSTKSLMLHDQKVDLLNCTFLTYRHC